MSDSKKVTLWEKMVNESNKVISVDSEVAVKAFMDEMPKELKAKKIGDVVALGEFGNYRKDFNLKFGSHVGLALANYAKANEEINESSVGFVTPDGVGMHVDFARPTKKDAGTDEWGQSFSHRQTLKSDEQLVTELRKTIGDIFSADAVDSE